MKAFILLFILSAPLFLRAQISLNEWMIIKPVTDSLHHNRNACLFGQYSNNLVFWDQELNSTTTQLCFREINNVGLGDERVALYQPDVKFTNPKIHDLSPYPQQNNFVVMFQTDEGSDIDLKSITYQTDGTFTSPVNISSLPGDDFNLTSNDNGAIAWENNGKIYISQYLPQTNSFTSPYAIDSAGANTPAFSAYGFYYLKPYGDSTRVIAVDIVYNANDWVINNVRKKSILGESSGLTTAGRFSAGSFCLQNKVGSSPSGLILSDISFSDMEYLNSPDYNYSQPAISDLMMIVKSGLRFLVFVSDSLTQTEVFAETPFYDGLYNLSQWFGEDRNPKMFVTFPEINVVAVNAFWESDHEGFSTIYYSHFDYLFGGTEESSKSENLSVGPSPFDKETTIAFRATENTQVRIIDLRGKHINSIASKKAENGLQKCIWDGTDFSGRTIPAGFYLVVINCGNTMQCKIIMKK